MTRLYHVLYLINKLLGEFNPVIRVIEHYTVEGEDLEYLNLRVRFPQANALIMLREYWREGDLVAYGYYIRIKGYEEWWDNRPHHPEISTHPHHRHFEGKVYPLQEPSLENFLERINELLHKRYRKGDSENSITI